MARGRKQRALSRTSASAGDPMRWLEAVVGEAILRYSPAGTGRYFQLRTSEKTIRGIRAIRG
jgi:hypothetical protein